MYLSFYYFNVCCIHTRVFTVQRNVCLFVARSVNSIKNHFIKNHQYRNEDKYWMIRISNLNRDKLFFCSPKYPDRWCGPQIFLLYGCRGSCPGLKRPGREVGHSPPSNAEVTNDWSSTYVSRTGTTLILTHKKYWSLQKSKKHIDWMTLYCKNSNETQKYTTQTKRRVYEVLNSRYLVSSVL